MMTVIITTKQSITYNIRNYNNSKTIRIVAIPQLFLISSFKVDHYLLLSKIDSSLASRDTVGSF